MFVLDNVKENHLYDEMHNILNTIQGIDIFFYFKPMQI